MGWDPGGCNIGESPEGQRGLRMCIISDTEAPGIAEQAKDLKKMKLEENH